MNIFECKSEKIDFNPVYRKEGEKKKILKYSCLFYHSALGIYQQWSVQTVGICRSERADCIFPCPYFLICGAELGVSVLLSSSTTNLQTVTVSIYALNNSIHSGVFCFISRLFLKLHHYSNNFESAMAVKLCTFTYH